MNKPSKNRRKAIIGTVLFHIGLLFCFIFMGLTYQIPPPPEEGITINFGYEDLGSGAEQPEQIIEEQNITPQEEVVENNPVVEEVSTQDIKETPATKIKQPKEKPNEVKKVEEKKPEPIVNAKALYPGKKQNKTPRARHRRGYIFKNILNNDPFLKYFKNEQTQVCF